MPTGVYARAKECLERLKKQGFQKGEPGPWLGKHHSKKTKTKISLKKKGVLVKEKSSRWKGGRILGKDGYILLFMPEHPQSNSKGYISEHRFMVEQQIGRLLKQGVEKVHHLNEIKDDNREENLMGFTSESAHQRFHHNPDNVRPEDIIFDGRKLNKERENGE